jgi:hypothetical protein
MDQRRSAVTRVLAASFALAIAMGPVAALDLDALSSDEVLTLQRRLVDAGCYPGLLDGQVSDALTAAVKACPDQDPVLRIGSTSAHWATRYHSTKTTDLLFDEQRFRARSVIWRTSALS